MPTLRAAIYTRVSSEDQAKHGYSLPSQVTECERKARELGAAPAPAFVDDGISGSTLDRPALRRLRDEVASGAFDLVVTLDPDRLSRDLRHLLALTDEIEAKAKLVFVAMEWERTPEGRLFLSLRGAVAEFERAKIRDRMMRGKRQKAAQGGIAQPPTKLLGYRYEGGSLTVVDDEAAAVRRIFELCVQGLGAHRIAEEMAAGGYTPLFTDRWWPQTVLRVLRNPVYMGTLRQFHQQRGRAGRDRDPVLVPVPAIVDAETFARAQECVRERARRNPGRSAAVRDLLLSGLARCGVCGSAMYSVGGAKHMPDPRVYTYYTCGRRTAQYWGRSPTTEEKCPNRPMAVRPADAAVWQAVVDLLDEPDAAWEERLHRAGGGGETEADGTKARLHTEIGALRAARDRVLDLVLRGTIGQDEADQALRDNTTRLQQAQSALKRLEADEGERRRQAAQSLADVRTLREAARAAASPEDRRAVLRQVLSAVVIHEDRRIELVPALAAEALPVFGASGGRAH